MPTDPWQTLALAAFAVAVTIGANWAASQLRRSSQPSLGSWKALGASLWWAVLVFIAGLIARRYVERIPHTMLGYSIFALVAVALSVIRAWLYQQSTGDGNRPSSGGRGRSTGLQQAVYPLFALVSLLALSLALRKPVAPVLVIPLAIGAFLPDLDSQGSWFGRILPFVPQWVQARWGSGGVGHSLAAGALVALIASPLVLVAGADAWTALVLGFFSHLLLDLVHSEGIMLLWPWRRTRYPVRGGLEALASARAERWLAAALAAIAVFLIVAAKIAPPKPEPVALPSYQETMEQYYDMRGRYLPLADLEGTWQASGRRVTGRFEILQAIDDSYILLDRYTGRVFRAGHSASDHVHIDRITLLAGPPVQIKAVEIHLDEKPLSAALPVVYQMQSEPGVQHIYISGDLIVPAAQADRGPRPRIDYAQMALRRIEEPNPGHFVLRYLTADEFIGLANVTTDTADLVVVATYAGSATGPTATPLPSPPPSPGGTSQGHE